MANNEDFIDKLKSLARLEVVMEQDGHHLSGRGRYRRSTEPTENSLVVDLNRQTYHWNSTGEWGDVITWVQKRKGCDFKEAVEYLAKSVGLPEPNWGGDNQARIATRAKEEAFGAAGAYFHELLLKDADALAYARSRGWSDETIKNAKLGYTGDKARMRDIQLAMRKLFEDMKISVTSPAAIAILGFNGNVAKLANENSIQVNNEWINQAYIPGLIGKDMLVYPHISGGRVRYFSGRGVHEKRHYNLPGELAGPRQAYFNHEWSAMEEACVIVEGQADAVTLAQWGIAAAALAGTSVDEEMFKRLEGHKNLYVGLDSDKAGKVNEWKVARVLGPMCRLVEWDGIMTFREYFDLEGNAQPIKDANDLLRAMNHEGAQSPENQIIGMQEALGRSLTLAEAMAEWAGRQNGAERDAALRTAMEVIAKMDELSLAQYSSGLAKSMRITGRDFTRMVKSTVQAASKKDEKGQSVEFTLGGIIKGWLVEYLYDTENHKGSLAWKDPDGKIGSGESVEIEGMKYAPMIPTDTLKNGGVLFPSAIGPLKSTGELVAIVENYIESVYLLPDHLSGKIMAYYALLTWLYDCFNTIPYLRAMGEAGSGKSELMRRLGMVCYRLMMANGAGTAASLFRSVERYRGTVFIDEADLQQSDTTNDIVKFLNLGAMRNNPIWRLEEVTGEGGRKEYTEKTYTTFCPKLIAMRKDFKDDAVGSRSLTFMIEPRETYELLDAGIPLEVNSEIRAKALALRNLLLRWRLEHWEPEIAVDPEFYEMDISSRLNQVTGPLMAVAKDDPVLRGEMRRFLREYYAELTLDKSMGVPARVIEAMWKIYKFPDLHKEMITTDAEGEKMLVGRVTRIANEIMDEMNSGGNEGGEEQATRKNSKDELSPHGIGKVIRKTLQMKISGRTNKGFYVYWDEKKMMALSKRYGINPEDIGPKEEMKSLFDHPVISRDSQSTLG